MRIYNFFNNKKSAWEEKFLLPQKKAFFVWLQKDNKLEDGESVVFLSEWAEVFTLRNGEMMKVPFKKANPDSFRFILRSNEVQWKLDKLPVLMPEVWQTIFSSRVCDVLENTSCSSKKGKIKPLRLGVSQEMRHEVTNYFRSLLGNVLKNGTASTNCKKSLYFDQYQDLDVALWVDGRLRASVIICNEKLDSALALAAHRVLQDTRFKPVSLEELDTLSIEITFMSDLVLPLTWQDYTENEIDKTKGYTVSLEGKKGWYLPAVHNVASFAGLQILLGRLLQEKARISIKDINVSNIRNFSQFEVFDWIEHNGEIFELTGPVVKENVYSEREMINTLFTDAIVWLGRIMEPDGNIPAVVASDGVKKQFDLVRLGCTGHALACAGRILKHKEALRIAERIYSFLTLPHILRLQTNLDSRVYFLRLALMLDKIIEKKEIEILIKEIPKLHKKPIVWLQVLSLLGEYEERNAYEEYRSLVHTETRRAFDDFLERRGHASVQLVDYAELIPLCSSLYKRTHDPSWKEKMLVLISWYGRFQQKDGAFSISCFRNFSYTRGTGKIFEALMSSTELKSVSLSKLLAWLCSMKNTNKNLFWASPLSLHWLIGGFRHDAFNREAWIDAAAHIILGCVRFLDQKR